MQNKINQNFNIYENDDAISSWTCDDHGRWLYWEPIHIVHNNQTLKNLSVLVEKGLSSRVVISLPYDVTHYFPSSNSVVCVSTNDTDENKREISNYIKKKLGFTPKRWKSNIESKEDLNENGWLTKYYKLLKIHKIWEFEPNKINVGQIDEALNLFEELNEIITNSYDNNQLIEMHYANLLTFLEHFYLVDKTESHRFWKQKLERDAIRKYRQLIKQRSEEIFGEDIVFLNGAEPKPNCDIENALNNIKQLLIANNEKLDKFEKAIACLRKGEKIKAVKVFYDLAISVSGNAITNPILNIIKIING